MAEIPLSWGAYARLQQKAARATDIAYAAALEQGLNIILKPDFAADATTDADFQRAADTAGRMARHRAALQRKYRGDMAPTSPVVETVDEVDQLDAAAPCSLDDAVHARRELERVVSAAQAQDIDLLLDVAVGIPYEQLARARLVSPGSLRIRVARLRVALAPPVLPQARVCVRGFA